LLLAGTVELGPGKFVVCELEGDPADVLINAERSGITPFVWAV